MVKYVLVECADRDIWKRGVYSTFEEAQNAMRECVAELVGDEWEGVDDDGYSVGNEWEVQPRRAWVNEPKNDTHNAYDFEILEV